MNFEALNIEAAILDLKEFLAANHCTPRGNLSVKPVFTNTTYQQNLLTHQRQFTVKTNKKKYLFLSFLEADGGHLGFKIT